MADNIEHQDKGELVANCDQFNSLKHSTVRSYAFTEQGVAMLSTVLRSETAIRISIRIMDAFVAIRRFMVTTPFKYNISINQVVIRNNTCYRCRFCPLSYICWIKIIIINFNKSCFCFRSPSCSNRSTTGFRVGIYCKSIYRNNMSCRYKAMFIPFHCSESNRTCSREYSAPESVIADPKCIFVFAVDLVNKLSLSMESTIM